jgi:hypothetical protein
MYNLLPDSGYRTALRPQTGAGGAPGSIMIYKKVQEGIFPLPDGDFVQPHRPISVFDLVGKECPG